MSRGRSWREVLRSLGKDPGIEGHDLIEAEAHLWHAHDAASQSVVSVTEASIQVASCSAKQRKTIDALVETARTARARLDDAAPAAARVGDALDRLRLVALNLGLEGARVGDATGRALTAVSDEIRAGVDRGAEALGDVQSALDDVRPAAGKVIEHAEQVRQAESEVATGAATAQTGAQEAAQSLEELARWARKLSETDPDTARTLNRASEHARALVAELSELQTTAQGELARAVLAPLVEPLARLLADLGPKRTP